MDIQLFGLGLVEHPPFSPALAPTDFRIFPTPKSALKGHRLETFHELTHVVNRLTSWYDSEWRQTCSVSGLGDMRNVFYVAVTIWNSE